MFLIMNNLDSNTYKLWLGESRIGVWDERKNHYVPQNSADFHVKEKSNYGNAEEVILISMKFKCETKHTIMQISKWTSTWICRGKKTVETKWRNRLQTRKYKIKPDVQTAKQDKLPNKLPTTCMSTQHHERLSTSFTHTRYNP